MTVKVLLAMINSGASMREGNDKDALGVKIRLLTIRKV
jgi:hypothetical protein